MSITEKDVENIGKLARLELSARERETYAVQLDKIFHWIEKLNELDTSKADSAEPSAGIENATREDVSAEFADREMILANAPEREGDFYKVRKIIEQQ